MSHRTHCGAPPESTSPGLQLLFTLDLAGNFKSVDPAAERAFGYRAAELRRMNIVELAPPNYRDYLREQIAGAVVGELGAVYEIEIFTRARQRMHLEISTRLVTRDGCPFELEGIAFPRLNTFGVPPRCLDEKFWIGPDVSGPKPLTFLPTR